MNDSEASQIARLSSKVDQVESKLGKVDDRLVRVEANQEAMTSTLDRLHKEVLQLIGMFGNGRGHEIRVGDEITGSNRMGGAPQGVGLAILMLVVGVAGLAAAVLYLLMKS